MAAHLRRASLIVLALCATASAQRQPKTITVGSSRGKLAFADLLEAHAMRYMGGLEPLFAMRGGEPVEPSVYVTVSSARIMVWDEEIASLTTAGTPMHADLANCPPTCIPKLRDAVARALAAESNRLRHAGAKTTPRVIVLADARLPHATLLAVAYSIANATGPAPPDLKLAIRAGEAQGKIAVIPFLLAPAHSLKISENANPILLHIAVEPRRFVVSARKSWLPWPEQSGSVGAVVRLIGELKARDTNKTAVFVTTAQGITLSRVLELVGPVRALYPQVIFGDMPQVTGPAE